MTYKITFFGRISTHFVSTQISLFYISIKSSYAIPEMYQCIQTGPDFYVIFPAIQNTYHRHAAS